MTSNDENDIRMLARKNHLSSFPMLCLDMVLLHVQELRSAVCTPCHESANGYWTGKFAIE